MIHSCHCTSNGAVTKQYCLCSHCIESHFSSSFPSQSEPFDKALTLWCYSAQEFVNGKRVGCHGRVRYVMLVWWQAKDNSPLEQDQLTQGPRAVRNACQDNALVVTLPWHNEALRETHGPKWQIWTLKFFHGVMHRHVKDPEQQTAE